jgi:hypothetical protein
MGLLATNSDLEGPMTTGRFEKSAEQARQLTSEKHSPLHRRSSNLCFSKNVLIAVTLLLGIGMVISPGSSGLELVALR